MTTAPDAWRLLLHAPLIVAAAAALSAGAIVLLRPLLTRYALARPNARSSHQVPTPQGGGLAVVAAALVTIAVCLAVLPSYRPAAAAPIWPILAATVLMTAVGAADDLRSLSIGIRLPLQIVAVGLVVGTMPSDMRLVPELPLWTERAILLLGGVYFVNIVNFMDGIDWITVAEVAPIAAGLAMIGAFGVLPPHETLVALALLGALVGFAPFNRPVAKLFLGDVGSLPIGLILGWLLLSLAMRGYLAAALLLPMYYLADASVTMVRRLIAGERIWQAHRTHFYQRATDRGFSVLEIDARIFVVNLGLVALAAASVIWAIRAVDAAALAVGAGLVVWLLYTLARGK